MLMAFGMVQIRPMGSGSATLATPATRPGCMVMALPPACLEGYRPAVGPGFGRARGHPSPE